MSTMTSNVSRSILRSLLLLPLLLGALAAHAATWYGEDDQDRKTVGTLSALLLPTRDADAVLEELAAPGALDEENGLAPVELMARSEPMEFIVIYHGCAPDSAGNCQSEIDYRIVDPEGDVIGELLNNVLQKDSPPTEELVVLLEVPTLELGEDNLEGLYTVQATLRDLVAGITMELSTSIYVLAVEEDN